ncbi:MAG TPA: anti-sigma factor [Mycobacteriales bacterium]|jgi:anti-sigma-K factor RskA|nr:anti-sigma factor [Mycobacteriales bacterium]
MTEHEYWDELAAGYALHGLAPDEELSFVAHLDTCELCAASMVDHELVAAQLGAIAHYRESDEAPSWDAMRTAIIGRAPAVADIVDLATRRRRYDVSRRALAAAAAVVVLAGGGIVTWRLASGGSNCSASSGCHAISLDARGQTEASLVVRGGRVTLTPNNMPAAPIGKTYVLWQLPRTGRATPVTDFTAGSGTQATGSLRVAYSDTEAFAVSEENTAGAPPATPSNTLASGTAS